MKKLIAILVVALLPSFVMAAGGSHIPFEMKPRVEDTASLQRGAKTFMNYCMGCHSLKFGRYNRVAKDLNIPMDVMEDNLLFADKKGGDLMTIGMRTVDSKKWFGATPPDLTLVARVRGDDWLYSYLKTFYKDESRPWGVNNLVFPKVGMPHVLADLQGTQELGRALTPVGIDPLSGSEILAERDDVLFISEPGELSAKEYDRLAYDLVNFLVYMGEPMALDRQRIGLWVLLFLMIFFVPVYLLNKEYWKDIH
jgi:ubiquinol-cytochrome c reductase cytochrome c1 subunit